MTETVADARATEADRSEIAAELSADSGPGWADGFHPGTFGGHELLDRAALFAGWLDRDLLRHPACVANPEWYALAARAVEALTELHQRVGAEHWADD